MQPESKLLPPSINIVDFANAKLLTDGWDEVQVGKLWQKQTIVFIFLRHFACIACRSHAVQVWSDRAKFEKNGGRLAFVGNGSPDFIQKFKEDLNIQGASVYTDPSLTSFRAAGFRRGFLAALGPQALANGLKLFKDGNSQAAYSKEAGDLWQLGGIVVVKSTGKVAYHYISEVMGDFPPHDDVEPLC